MNLIKRNAGLAPVFNGFFDDFLSRDLANWDFLNHSATTLPAANIVESHDNFVVEIAAPGMDKKDFKVELDNDTLTVSSEKEVKNELNNGDRYTRREFSYQSFKRTFNLPKSVVDEGKIKAKYENGVLRLMIPKRENAKTQPPRMIAIQ